MPILCSGQILVECHMWIISERLCGEFYSNPGLVPWHYVYTTKLNHVSLASHTSTIFQSILFACIGQEMEHAFNYILDPNYDSEFEIYKHFLILST
jgi:hypothetical protein